MWQRFTFTDLRIIAHYLGALTMFLVVALCVPLATSVVMQEWNATERYLFGIGIALFIGSALRLAYLEPRALTQQQALAVTGLAWLLLALVGAIPLYMSGHFISYLDAFFEGMSAWTTTGASMIQDLEHLSTADNMWRFVMQTVGGLGVVVIALSLGIFGSSGGSSLYATEGRSEHVIPNIIQTTQFIVRVAAVAILTGTVVLFLACQAIGMEPSRALLNGFWLSTASFNTGGMSSMSLGINYYHSWGIEIIVLMLMLFGTVNFTLYNEIWRGRIEHFFKDIEVRTSAVWLIVVVGVVTTAICVSGRFSNLPTLVRRGVFTIVSAFTTAGFQPITSNQLTTIVSSGALIVLVFVMIVGGSAGSTSGGIKVLRVGILGKELVAYVKDLLAPASARQVVTFYHVGKRPLGTALVRANLAVFLLFLAALMLTTIVTVAFGYEASPALFESASMVSNIGMSAGIVQPGMPDVLKYLYIFDMWAGRLEWVTLVALLVSFSASLKPKKRVGHGR